MSQRSFYNRTKKVTSSSNSESVKSGTTLDVSSTIGSTRTSSTTRKPFQRNRKFSGVRRLSKIATNVNRSNNNSNRQSQKQSFEYSFRHGRSNPIISHLLQKRPRLLAQILSVRYTAKGKPLSDFVMSLFLQSGEENDGHSHRQERTKRPRAVAPIATTSTTHSHHSVDRELPSSTGDDPDMICEGDMMFLEDFVEEQQYLRKRRSQQPRRNSGVESLPRYEMDTTMQNETVGTSEPCDDLTWITRQMEDDWNRFLDKTRPTTRIHTDHEVDGVESNTCTHSHSTHAYNKQSWSYKSFIMLNRRTQCDLGSFENDQDAAFVHDMYAIGRRTLGMKVLQDHFIRQRVKIARASYEEKERLLNLQEVQQEQGHSKYTGNQGEESSPTSTHKTEVQILSPGEIARKATQHISDASQERSKHTSTNSNTNTNGNISLITIDPYFSSDKVLYPDLNSFPNTRWNLVHPFPFLKDSMFTLDVVHRNLSSDATYSSLSSRGRSSNGSGSSSSRTNKDSLSHEVLTTWKETLDTSPDVDFLKEFQIEMKQDEQEFSQPTSTSLQQQQHHEDSILPKLSHLESDLTIVKSKVGLLQRLAALESNVSALLELERESSSKVALLFKNGMRYDNNK